MHRIPNKDRQVKSPNIVYLPISLFFGRHVVTPWPFSWHPYSARANRSPTYYLPHPELLPNTTPGHGLFIHTRRPRRHRHPAPHLANALFLLNAELLAARGSGRMRGMQLKVSQCLSMAGVLILFVSQLNGSRRGYAANKRSQTLHRLLRRMVCAS
jgi:hypothetical protein